MGSAAKAMDDARSSKQQAARFIWFSLTLSQFFCQIGFAADVGQAEIAAQVGVSQLGVLQAKQREDAGVEIVEVNGISDGPQPEFVGGADDLATLDSAAGHPDREAIRIVVAAFGATRAAIGDG